jgi:NAD(P)-dependent dehydrogenase (short-subunit alcohol dehydrogenase family)
MNAPDQALAGQVAIVTAGANGLGEGCALALGRHGATVVVADIDEAAGANVVQALKHGGGDGLFVRTDMLKTDQIEAMVAHAAQAFGRIDILVNNAGGVKKRLFADSFEKSWRKHIDMNLVSMLSATHAVLQVMIPAARGGAILNMSSVEGLRGAPGSSVYAACKAGMLNFTRTLAAELADDGIRVNALAPDMIATKGIVDFVPNTPQASAARERYIPLRRMGRPEEVGEIAAFLCSPAAAYLTGITLPIDGGTMSVAGFTRSPDAGDWRLLHY